MIIERFLPTHGVVLRGQTGMGLASPELLMAVDITTITAGDPA
jgi:hypothetical protein